MAVRHVDVVERMFGLANLSATGDSQALDELVTAYHDDASLEGMLGEPPAVPGGAGVREYFAMVTSSYEEWQCALDYVQDYGERVLALGALRAVRAGAEREYAAGWIFTFRDDKVAAVKAYPSYGDALRAATTRTADVNTA